MWDMLTSGATVPMRPEATPTLQISCASLPHYVVVAERRWRATKLIWRDSTPQHYATLSGFYNTNAKIINWPMSGNGECVPIKDSFRVPANGRNSVAEHILKPLLTAPPSNPARLEYMNTFSFDVARHAQHPYGKLVDSELTALGPAQKHRGTLGDCTHFCLHSEVTSRWLETLVALLMTGAAD